MRTASLSACCDFCDRCSVAGLCGGTTASGTRGLSGWGVRESPARGVVLERYHVGCRLAFVGDTAVR
jgi:hypothetical protein